MSVGIATKHHNLGFAGVEGEPIIPGPVSDSLDIRSDTIESMMDVNREEVMVELRIIAEDHDLGEADHCREIINENGER